MRPRLLAISALAAAALTACVSASVSTSSTTASSGTARASAQGVATTGNEDAWWPAHAVGAVHTIMPSPTTVVYGGYDPEATPALRVKSGDEVIVGAVSTCGARLLRPGVDTGTIEPAYRAIAAAVRDSTLKRGPGGHILTGPIYVDGADPGDVLEVRIEKIDVDLPYACNGFSPRGGWLPEDFPGVSRMTIIPLDLQHMVAHFSDSLGIMIPLHPFFGSIGVAPAPEEGRVNSAPPGKHAGNLDNKELVAGTILYIPVHTRGALLEIGDGHAGQGDGEVDITALETSLSGRFQLIVRKDLHFDWPRGETRDAWIAMGTDSSLTVATKTAVRQAIALLGDTYHLAPADAYQLVSTGANVRVTQLVDGTVGVHVMIPKGLFTRGAQ
ncbi:MAG TPA: acetamidase/formamidase family protein [Gemmatimonadaceae bacterium]|nr:acetamidase/formamidase family protein [Gemmatimonadaceae bacterium]